MCDKNAFCVVSPPNFTKRGSFFHLGTPQFGGILPWLASSANTGNTRCRRLFDLQMLRRVTIPSGATATIHAAAATLASQPSTATRTHFHIPCKGKVEYRLDNHIPFKSQKEIIADHETAVANAQHPNPRNKKEALQHLLERPSYEYVSDMQRAANDMMAVHSDPVKYSYDMAYHYHRIWKQHTAAKTWSADGNGAYELVKIHPNS